jgi:hypothetical protein
MWAFGQGTIAKNILPFSVRSGQCARKSSFWHGDRTRVFRAKLEGKLFRARILTIQNLATHSLRRTAPHRRHAVSADAGRISHIPDCTIQVQCCSMLPARDSAQYTFRANLILMANAPDEGRQCHRLFQWA